MYSPFVDDGGIGYNTYVKYAALKRHFQSDYDYIKYNGKVNIKRETFLKRNDRYFFAKLAKKYNDELTDFLISNFVVNDNIWIRELFSDESEKIYKNWKKNLESFSYIFKSDMKKIKDHMEEKGLSFDDMFECDEENLPEIVNLLIGNTIQIETFIMLDQVLNFICVINKKVIDNAIWMLYNKKLVKYRALLFYVNKIKKDPKHYKEIMQGVFV
jgi:hypothetical protein